MRLRGASDARVKTLGKLSQRSWLLCSRADGLLCKDCRLASLARLLAGSKVHTVRVECLRQRVGRRHLLGKVGKQESMDVRVNALECGYSILAYRHAYEEDSECDVDAGVCGVEHVGDVRRLGHEHACLRTQSQDASCR